MDKKFKKGEYVRAEIYGNIYDGDDFNGYEIEYISEDGDTCYASIATSTIHRVIGQ